MNCTVRNNSASQGGGVLTGTPMLTNCIVWGNDDPQIEVGGGSIDFCDVEGGWEGEGNIDLDPFLGAGSHLSLWSPCIDAGTPDGAPVFDFEGDPRPFGVRPDIGADEYWSPLVLQIGGAPAQAFEGDTLDLELWVFNPLETPGQLDSLVMEISWQGGSRETIHSGPTLELEPGDSLSFDVEAIVPAELGTDTVTFSAFAHDSIASAERFDLRVRPADGVIDVPGELPSIEAGIAAAFDGEVVRLARGSYAEAGLDFGGKAITVTSIDPYEPGCAAETVIDARGEGRTFVFRSGEGAASVLAGITITGGSDERGAAIACFGASPTIQRCTIEGNSADFGFGTGGGVYCESASPALSHCIITANDAGYFGGGLYCDLASNPSLTNCIVADNSARLGGGLFCVESSPVLLNSTIAGNSAALTSYAGGGISCGVFSNPSIVNCILWGDTPNELAVDLGEPWIRYSDIEGGWPGLGNIDADPDFRQAFAFRFLLGPRSDCIDAGDPAIADALFDVHPRWPAWHDDGPRSDMGAYGGPANHRGLGDRAFGEGR